MIQLSILSSPPFPLNFCYISVVYIFDVSFIGLNPPSSDGKRL